MLNTAVPSPAARLAFLAGLGDALRPLGDPVAVQEAAARALGEHLGADRVMYGEVAQGAAGATDEAFVVYRDYRRGGMPSAARRHRFDDYGAYVAGELRAGRTLVVPDVAAVPEHGGAEQAAYDAIAIRAYVAVPLVKGGRIVACLAVNQRAPRAWTADEVALVQDTAERTWAAVERARAEAALRATETRFRTVQDASPLGFCIHRPIRDADGAVVDFVTPYINAAGAQIVGQPPERVMAERLLAIWPAAGTEGIVADYARVLATGASNVRELLYEHDELAAGLTLTAVRIGAGPDAEVGVTFTDVTARLRADRERARLLAELGAERERLRAVILHMPAPVALAEGPEHRFALVNDAYKRASGGGHDVTGLTPREAFPELAGSGIHERFDLVYASGEPWAGPETLVRYDRDGAGVQDVWFNARLEPVRDGAGRVVALLNFNVDVTEQVRARRAVEGLLAESEAARGEADAARAEAEAARRGAEAANRAKAEFLATMSHELRTPLNAIGGYAELLALGITGPVTDAQRRQLERVQASQRHLLGLVNEVLDLSKVDAGAVAVAREPVAAAGTVDAALALVRPQAAAKGLALTDGCDAPPDGPGAVRYVGDEPRVRQILVNLLANAVKFTPGGGRVTVACALGGAPPGGPRPGGVPHGAAETPYVALRVEDTGVGVAPDQRERIFEPFAQAGAGSNPYTRAVGGTGLGLTISRRLARLMGGDLTVESAAGAGSMFTLWLPLAERRAHPRPASAPGAGTAALAPPAPPPLVAPAAALAHLGDTLLNEAGPIVRAWAARLRADPAVPTAHVTGSAFTDVELHDHAATFVTDIALALRTVAAGGEDAPALLRDGTAILATVAERHGAQRARLGWPAEAVALELAVLGEELALALDRAARADDAAAVARARALVDRLLERAVRVSLGGHRLARAQADFVQPSDFLPPVG